MNIGNLTDFILYDLFTFWFHKTLSFLEPIIIIIMIIQPIIQPSTKNNKTAVEK